MSRQVIIKKRDDLDPSLDADETLEFTFGGVAYQVDVCTQNGDAFREFLQPYMEHAFDRTRIKGTKKVPSGDLDARAMPDEVRDRVRKWAKSNGLADAVDNNGAIKFEIRSAYYDATGDEEALNASVMVWREKRERAMIRDWAQENNIQVRGSIIPKQVLVAYAEAHPNENVQPIKKVTGFGDDYHARAGKAAKDLAIPDKALRVAIREWAVANGYEPGDRGFIPGEIQDAYHMHLLEQKHGKDVAV